MIGQTVSHYKILEKLGEGGMGVVYKAHDTKLDRDVALKFLPRDLSPTEEERTRFIHEAKAASTLDHPNICTIYEVDETPDGRMFIVMGYYDGESLTRKIQKGRLKVEDASCIAIQIAEGLQAAHDRGIVHRDIKSGNIIITDNGQVKILDFGLARKKGLSKLTKTGTTVGTASYMSPEQARGESVDQRTDIWSLGVVLYEMVTGRLPFRGEHDMAILYSVVNEEPQPVQTAIAGASPELVHIIRRALEKEAGERYQSAADMLIDLRRLKKDTSRTGFTSLGDTRTRLTRKRKKLSLQVGGAILLILVVLWAILISKRSTGINAEWEQHPLQIPFTDIGNPGISADGNWIAFYATDPSQKWGIYLMHSARGEPRLITLVEHPGFEWVDLSADGSMIVYDSYDVQYHRMEGYIVTSTGGTPKRIFQGWFPRFRPDMKRVGYILPSQRAEFWTVGIDGSDPRREFIDSVSRPPVGSYGFSYSPDAKRVAWIRDFPNGGQELIAHNLETGTEKQLTFDNKNISEIAWVQEDQILYTTDKNGFFNLWMISAKGGEPVQVTKGTEPIMGVKSSADGRKVVYLQQRTFGDLWVVDIAAKSARQITFTEENKNFPMFSPDGKEIACYIGFSTNYEPSHLYVMDRNGGNKRQLSFGDEFVGAWAGLGLGDFPLWSPDGGRIAYGSQKAGTPADSLRAYLIELSNPGSPKYIAPGLPSGAWLDSTRLMVDWKGAISLTSIDRAPLTRVYDDSTLAYFIQGGKYILYWDKRRGRKGLWITDGTKSREVQRRTARKLQWEPANQWQFDGRGKILWSVRGIGEVSRMSLPNGKDERIPGEFFGVKAYGEFSLSWDGREAVVVKHRQSAKLVMIENLFK